jgi:hypothetical protein
LPARADLDALAALLDNKLAQGLSLPQNLTELTALWEEATGRSLPTRFVGSLRVARERCFRILWTARAEPPVRRWQNPPHPD